MNAQERERIYREVAREYLIEDIKDWIENNYIDCLDEDEVEDFMNSIDYNFIARQFEVYSRFDWHTLDYCISTYLDNRKEE